MASSCGPSAFRIARAAVGVTSWPPAITDRSRSRSRNSALRARLKGRPPPAAQEVVQGLPLHQPQCADRTQPTGIVQQRILVLADDEETQIRMLVEPPRVPTRTPEREQGQRPGRALQACSHLFEQGQLRLRQADRRNRSSTRTPNSNEATGTRSSMPWKRAVKSRSGGNCSGANPKQRMPSRDRAFASVPPESV